MGKTELLFLFQLYSYLIVPRVTVILEQNPRQHSAIKEDKKPG